MQTRERLGYVDFMRGVAIILVVVGHMIQFNGVETSNAVFEVIYSFHMPLFFAISGYITQKVTRLESVRQYGGYMKKKVISILVPYMVWLLLADHYLLAEHWETLTAAEVWHCITGWTGLWFLKTLFIILVGYGLFNLVLNKFKRVRVLALAVAFIPVAVISAAIVALKVEGANLFMYSYTFYLGVMLSLFPRADEWCMKDLPYSTFFLVFMVLVTHWSFDNRVMADDVIKVGVSTSAFVLLLGLSRKLNVNPMVNNEIQRFGRNSMIIYILQFHLVKLHTGFLAFVNEGGGWNQYIFLLACVLASVPICYLCIFFAKCIGTSRLLSLLLLGKRNG